MNMVKWFDDLRQTPAKKAMPILSFPSIQLLGVGVKELISDSDLQANGMKAVADRVDAAAALSMMDLSVEAEALGAAIRISDDEVPTVVGHVISTEAEAEALAVPPVGAGRTGLYIEAIRKACTLITDRPVFAGVIGPFSLAGRLLDVSEAMLYCYDAPEMVHKLLDKVTGFSTAYINAYKQAGANGVVIAEPLAGVLSPAFNEEFSARYVKRIVDVVQTDDFAVVYHNCGGGAVQMLDAIASIGARGYHFGNAIDLAEVLATFPAEAIVMGNLDPTSHFRNGTPESTRAATLALLEKCHGHPNFVISSGCDIPPMSKWENIDAFFTAVADFYAGQR
ncbi:MAG: uroporphyrinogen decarboxylase family protein [Kiritimatiellaeota bacterium]|nr:uroporphyrinogen decarboxylase family protein [Kiritimatiellota bacterium]